LAQGAGQAAGGEKENNSGEKLAKAILLKSCTTHGVVSGRGTGGSAVAVFGEPITRTGAGNFLAEGWRCRKHYDGDHKKPGCK